MKRAALAAGFVAPTEIAGVMDEFAVDLGVVGTFGGEGAKGEEGEFAIAVGPVDRRGEQAPSRLAGDRATPARTKMSASRR